MPPVMGAAAFIMAEFLQVPYGSVCIAAAIPALLYYLCLFFHVDLEAAKHKIGSAKIAEAPAVSEVLKSGWHFLVPIAFLVFALMYPELSNLTPEKAAIYSTAILIVLAMIFGYRGKRLGVINMLKAIMETGRVSLDIILIGAAAGIMVGIMSISGLAFSMTIQLLALAAGNVFLLLLLIAVLAFILGIGLPTVSVYILTATLLAPALVKLGVTPMAAHMFVMYNGILSMITPPVAFAAYAAANIARTDGWTTGWMACVVGWSTFILPFLFVLTPSLLMDGSWTEIALNFSRVTFGIWLGTVAAVGFSLARLNPMGRATYAVISLAVVLPPEAFAGAIWINVAGVTAAIVVLAIDWMRGKKGAAEVPATPY
jgi:TRAP transporter 4TM/12TM fusion protein